MRSRLRVNAAKARTFHARLPLPPTMTAPALTRRALLRSSAALAAAVYAGLPGCTGRVRAIDAYPFTLGVASGEPAPDGVVLWTRLAPDPYDDDALGPANLPVTWEVAEDEAFQRVVQQGIVETEAEWAHSIHLQVTGLRPDRWYWYRFRAGDAVSPMGRTRTLPATGAPCARWKLGLASCQHFEQGYFTAYRHMAADDLDVVFHVGDYIYERSRPGGRVRRHVLFEAKTLTQYRARYAQYKQDPDLQAAHAAFPWVVTWDDHEVENDYAGRRPGHEEPLPDFETRQAAAYRAYYEHMPLGTAARPRGRDLQLYRAFSVGDLASFSVLDSRQYRDGQPCPGEKRYGGQMVTQCAERLAAGRTMLGPAQERWLADGLGSSRTRWNVLVQQLLMAQLKRVEKGAAAYWSDGWDGYAAARGRLLAAVRDRRVPNVVTLGGDIHSFWVTDLKVDFDDPGGATVATEFVGTSIATSAGKYAYLRELLPTNPHVRFMESRLRGYLRAEISPGQWRSDLRVVEDVTRQVSPARTLASFVVESGRPGAVPA
jgi:alkaline phosphatase D